MHARDGHCVGSSVGLGSSYKALRRFANRRIIHGDIKPANIFLTEVPVESGEAPHAKVGDFGHSIQLPPGEAAHYKLRGTPHYISPEQMGIAFDSATDTPSKTRFVTTQGFESDMWSFGVMLYELLTLQHPFGIVENPMTIMYRVGTWAQEGGPFESLQGQAEARSHLDRNLEDGTPESAAASKLFVVCKGLMQLNPVKRLSAAVVVAHLPVLPELIPE